MGAGFRASRRGFGLKGLRFRIRFRLASPRLGCIV